MTQAEWRRAAEAEGVSLSEFVRRAVNEALGSEVVRVASAPVLVREPVVPVFVPISSKAKPEPCGFRDHLAPVNKCSLPKGHSGPCSWQT